MSSEINPQTTEVPVEESTPTVMSDEDLFAYIDNMSSGTSVPKKAEDKPANNTEDSNDDNTDELPVDTENTDPKTTDQESVHSDDSTKIKEPDDTIESDDNSSDNGRDDVETDTVSKEDLAEALKSMGIKSKDKLDELYKSSKLNRVKVKEYSQFDDHIHIVKEAKLNTKDLALATEALNGNMDAIRKIIKDKGLDPLDLIVNDEEVKDQENFNSKYEQDDSVKAFKEATLLARAKNVEADFLNAFSNWDEKSLSDMMTNKNNVNLFIKELSDGSFAKINDILKQELDNDFSGSLEAKDSLDQYIYAQKIYRDSLNKQEAIKKSNPPKKEVKKQDNVNTNNKKLEEAKKASEQTKLSNSGISSQNDYGSVYPRADEDFFAMFDKQFN